MGLSEESKKRRNALTDKIKTFKPEDNVDYFFISYKSDDWETVIGKIVKTLIEQYGIRVYFDKNFDEDNESWVENMKAAIKTGKCKAVLSFVSKTYMESYACLMELLTARSKWAKNTHRDKKLPIIPILLGGGGVKDYTSASSEKVKVEEWDEYQKIVDNAYENTSWIEGALKDAIEVVKDNKSKTTIEEMSLAMESILMDKTHPRDYENGTEHFYNSLSKALRSESETIFDVRLINNDNQHDVDSMPSRTSIAEEEQTSGNNSKKRVDKKRSEKVKHNEFSGSNNDNALNEPSETPILSTMSTFSKERNTQRGVPEVPQKQSEESSDDFAEGDNLFDDIDLSDFETDEEDSFGGAEIFDDPFSAKSLDNGNKDILNDNLREKDKKWGILTLHNELDFPMGVIRFQYSTGDEFGFGREIVGLQINTDIIPCRYEGSGTYYEPEYLIFDSLFESLRISCPPNDRVIFYVDPDRFILTEDHAELTLILGTEPAKTKVNDILKEIKGHSKLRIEIDRLNKRAVVSELRANDVIERSVEIDISSDTSDISGKKQDDGNDSFGFDFGQDDEYELLDFGFNLAELNENTTLSEFEKICENVNFCMELRKVRKDKTVTAQLFDYFMASLLGGCDSPAMKKEDILRKAVYNYCKYAVAKDCDPNTVGFGASQWTWSSNARKAVRPEDRPADYYDANGNFKGSGKLGANSDIFEKLPRNLTIGDVLKKYENREVGFNTKDNEMIFRSWALIKELNNG